MVARKGGQARTERKESGRGRGRGREMEEGEREVHSPMIPAPMIELVKLKVAPRILLFFPSPLPSSPSSPVPISPASP